MRIIPHRPDLQQEYHNPFKENDIYPFNKIGRCIVDKDTAEIKRWCDENDSNFDINKNPINLDPNTEDVMVYIPAFYCKRHWNGTTLTDSILSKVPTTVTYSHGEGEYKVHPAFLRSDNTIRPYILVGAFLGSVKSSQLRSVTGAKIVEEGRSISSLRTYARNGRTNNYNIITFDVINAIQLLYKVSFQSLDSKLIIGKVNKNSDNATTLGRSMEMGNKSGLNIDNNIHTITLFGIEDFYGSIWQYADGVVAKNDGYYITNNQDDYGFIERYTLHQQSIYSLDSVTDTLAGKIENDSIYNFLNTQPEADQNTYYCSMFRPHKKGINSTCIFGGYYGSYKGGGTIFCLDFKTELTYIFPSTVGTRLCYLP